MDNPIETARNVRIPPIFERAQRHPRTPSLSHEETSQNGADLYAVEADLRGTVPEWRHTGRQPRSRLIIEELLPWAYAAMADV